jgi:hypothetical protein
MPAHERLQGSADIADNGVEDTGSEAIRAR